MKLSRVPSQFFHTMIQVIFWLLLVSQCSIATTPLPPIQASAMLPLTSNMMSLVVVAAQLGNASFYKDAPESLSGIYIDTGGDAVLMSDIDSYCFVSFRGSKAPTSINKNTIDDWLFENLNFDDAFVVNRNNPTEGCSVQKGFYTAYVGVGEDQIHSFIDNCMKTDNNKQLVFTGHSQGGAAAVVAAIINNDYNPLTITFGQPPVVRDDCSYLNHNNIWRFINTENSNGGLQYDPVPFIDIYEPKFRPNMIGHHIGAAIHLPPNNEGNFETIPVQSTTVHRPINDTKSYMKKSDLDIWPDNGEAFSAHDVDCYVTKLMYLQSKGSDPLQTSGYITGTECQKDFECQIFVQSGTGGCSNNVCVDSYDVKSCDNESDCPSGRCDYNWSWKLVCQDQKDKGSMCNEDSDCISGACTWKFRCT